MLGQPINVAMVVLIGEEAGLSVVAALGEMDGDVRQGDASASRHEGLRWVRLREI